MRTRKLKRNVPLALLLVALVAGAGITHAQNSRDAVETLKSTLRADRQTVIAGEMKLTPQESEVFWPLYRSYRAETEKVTDQIAELVLEYADVYPNVSDQKAGEMLDRYAKIEKELLTLRMKYLKKMKKALPPSKVFQFAQLDNRFDLAVRVGIASALPLLSQAATEQTH